MLDLLHGWLIAPFDYAFMRRALAACVVLALTAPVVGVLLTLRGMSLMGEALSHAILPGVALAFVLAGFSLPLMMLGGVVAAGLMLLPAATARFWSQRLEGMIVIAIGWALVSSLAGLLASYHLALPAGPSIVLLAGAGYLVSVLVGPKGGWLAWWGSQRRREVTL